MTRRRVLLVDDDWVMLFVMRDALESEGYRVFWLDRSLHVPAVVVATEPDLLVIDIRMPGMTGLQVIGELEGKGFNVPLIITSGLDPDGERSLGGHAYLPKPFGLEELRDQVLEIIGPGAPNGELTEDS